ncbi:MAG: CDP-diacylglycerol--glycerol-3-phosphate 3-phosphatidyltransferase [Pseudomonadota bacterium]
MQTSTNAIPKWKKELPMVATYSRIVLSLVIVFVLSFPFPYSGWVNGLLFMLASITDWLDGYWARKYKAESVMGQFMDPIADKLLVLPVLIMLLQLNRVDPYMVILLSGRDIFIGGIRSVAAANQVIIAAKPFGKWKTAFQMVSIPMLLINMEFFGIPFPDIGRWGLWASVVLSILSGAQYTFGYWKGRKTA